LAEINQTMLDMLDSYLEQETKGQEWGTLAQTHAENTKTPTQQDQNYIIHCQEESQAALRLSIEIWNTMVAEYVKLIPYVYLLRISVACIEEQMTMDALESFRETCLATADLIQIIEFC
jgi:hypothetical protein